MPLYEAAWRLLERELPTAPRVSLRRRMGVQEELRHKTQQHAQLWIRRRRAAHAICTHPPSRTRRRFLAVIAIRRSVIIEVVMGAESVEPHPPQAQPATWNDPIRIAVHRHLSPSARIQLMIEASRAALRFARGRRVDER